MVLDDLGQSSGIEASTGDPVRELRVPDTSMAYMTWMKFVPN